MTRRLLITVLFCAVCSALASGQQRVASAPLEISFPTSDGGLIFADAYGRGKHAVVLAHGGQYQRRSWNSQALELERAGFAVIAIDLRGFGKSTGPGQSDPESAPLHLDVLAAVRYFRAAGAQMVSVVGASMGGWAAVDAAILARPGEIDRLVVLGAGAGNLPPQRLSVPKLFIISRSDTSGSGLRLPQIQTEFAQMPEPKRLMIVDGSAHAQALFQSSQGPEIMRSILQFLRP